jgi:hypothetical protein
MFDGDNLPCSTFNSFVHNSKAATFTASVSSDISGAKVLTYCPVPRAPDIGSQVSLPPFLKKVVLLRVIQ